MFFLNATFALLTAAAPLTPAAQTRIDLTPTTAQYLRLRIEQSQEDGRVIIKNSRSGSILFAERYRGKAFGRRFDFQKLPAGRYTVLVHTGGQRYRYEVTLSEESGRTLKLTAPAATAPLAQLP